MCFICFSVFRRQRRRQILLRAIGSLSPFLFLLLTFSTCRMEASSSANGVRNRDGERNTHAADYSEHLAPSTSSGGLYHHNHRHRHESAPTVSYLVNASLASENVLNYSEFREEAWSCVVVLLTFWFFGELPSSVGSPSSSSSYGG